MMALPQFLSPSLQILMALKKMVNDTLIRVKSHSWKMTYLEELVKNYTIPNWGWCTSSETDDQSRLFHGNWILYTKRSKNASKMFLIWSQ